MANFTKNILTAAITMTVIVTLVAQDVQAGFGGKRGGGRGGFSSRSGGARIGGSNRSFGGNRSRSFSGNSGSLRSRNGSPSINSLRNRTSNSTRFNGRNNSITNGRTGINRNGLANQRNGQPRTGLRKPNLNNKPGNNPNIRRNGGNGQGGRIGNMNRDQMRDRLQRWGRGNNHHAGHRGNGHRGHGHNFGRYYGRRWGHWGFYWRNYGRHYGFGYQPNYCYGYTFPVYTTPQVVTVVEPAPAPIVQTVPAAPSIVVNANDNINVAETAKAAIPTTDQLIGSWKATPTKGMTIQTSLKQDGTFEWNMVMGDQKQSVKGKYTLNGDTLTLTTDKGDAMVGLVKMTGEKGFNFKMKESPAEDPGLNFEA